MAKDRDGRELKVGDEVTIRCQVDAIWPDRPDGESMVRLATSRGSAVRHFMIVRGKDTELLPATEHPDASQYGGDGPPGIDVEWQSS